MRTQGPISRRNFAMLLTAAAGAAVAPALIGDGVAANAITLNDDLNAKPHDAPPAQSAAPPAADDTLQSEFLLDLVFDRGQGNSVGSVGVNRVVVPVLGGTFEGPKLKGTVTGPGGDWIIVRPDGSSVLDLRILLQTDDAQKIYMTSRGIAYTTPEGSLFARIQPVFETGAAKYAWLNNVVAVGVFRPVPGKVAYRIYRIL